MERPELSSIQTARNELITGLARLPNRVGCNFVPGEKRCAAPANHAPLTTYVPLSGLRERLSSLLETNTIVLQRRIISCELLLTWGDPSSMPARRIAVRAV